MERTDHGYGFVVIATFEFTSRQRWIEVVIARKDGSFKVCGAGFLVCDLRLDFVRCCLFCVVGGDLVLLAVESTTLKHEASYDLGQHSSDEPSLPSQVM